MLYILLIERRKRGEKRRNGQGAIFPGQMHPSDCAALGFSRLLGAIKSCGYYFD
jgi:hypothetical protein